eukprot:3937850-Rhodomonas_salina.2
MPAPLAASLARSPRSPLPPSPSLHPPVICAPYKKLHTIELACTFQVHDVPAMRLLAPDLAVFDLEFHLNLNQVR